MKKISFIFTYDYSALTWKESGTLSRELQLFKELSADEGFKFQFITYGNEKDLEIFNTQGNFDIVPIYSICKYYNNKYLRFLSSFLIPFKISDKLSDSDIIYQNQLNGSWISIVLKYITKKPLLIRTGYDTYLFSIKDKKSFFIRKFYKQLTKYALKFSDLYTVTSHSDYKFLKNTFNAKNVKITRNWTNLSENVPIAKNRRKKILCVGRLVEQKNYDYLFQELAKLNTPIELDVVGNGPLKKMLIEKINKYDLKVNFLGNLDHEALSELYLNYKFYILPSLYEGNPKTLIEAMGAGCIVIASDIENNKEIVDHNKNGFIFKLSNSNFLDVFTEIDKLTDEKLSNIQKNGVSRINREYSLKVIKKETLRDLKNLFVG